jgi:hypothetical protein
MFYHMIACIIATTVFDVLLPVIVTPVLFVPFGGCKKSPRTFNQRCYIFDPWRSFSMALFVENTCYVVCLDSSFWLFNLGGFSIPTWILYYYSLWYVACLLLLIFDIISVICMLHNLRLPFNIPFYFIPPIDFRAFFYFGTIRRFLWNVTSVHIEGSMITACMDTSANVSKIKIAPFSC